MLTRRRAAAGAGLVSARRRPLDRLRLRRRPREGHRQRERGILREDRAFELAQPLAGLDPELSDEDLAGVLIGLQRLGLPVAAVQSEHQLRPEALPVRVLVDEGLELTHHLGVPRQSQLRVDQLLDGRHSQIVQPVDFVPGEGLIGQLAERTAAPESEPLLGGRESRLRIAGGGSRPGRIEQPLEAPRVHLVRVDSQLIAVLAGDEHVGRAAASVAGQSSAQAVDVNLNCLRGGGRRTVAPELVDEPVGRDRLVRAQKEQRQKSPLLAAAERNLHTLI